jgi:hypothetical protein
MSANKKWFMRPTLCPWLRIGAMVGPIGGVNRTGTAILWTRCIGPVWSGASADSEGTVSVGFEGGASEGFGDAENVEGSEESPVLIQRPLGKHDRRIGRWSGKIFTKTHWKTEFETYLLLVKQI